MCEQTDSRFGEIFSELPEKESEVLVSPKNTLLVVATIVNMVEMIR